MATKYCGNCPGRFETPTTSKCRIYGALPWGMESDPHSRPILVDMLRPVGCATKPKNRYEVHKRRTHAQPTNDETRG